MFNLLKKFFGSDAAQATSKPPESEVLVPGVTYTSRQGKSIQVDQAFIAWTSGDLNAMLAAVGAKTNPVDRHFLLQGIVAETYKRRAEPSMRRLCEEHAMLHLTEFAAIAPVLKRQCQGTLPRVTTFQHLATILTEDGRYEQAISTCRTALSYNLEDGTKSGFEGRIARILKARGDA